jgi:hypothetical protein
MSTQTTILGRVGGFHKNDCPASVFSFALESLLEVSPTGIEDALGEVPVNHAPYRQIFNCDATKPQNKIVRQLVQEVFSLVGDVLRESRQDTNRFASIGTAALSPSNPPLKDTKPSLRPAIPPGILNRLPGGEHEKAGKTCIYTNLVAVLGKWVGLNLTTEGCVPLPGFPADAKRLDFTLKLPMPPDCNATNTREFQPSTIQPEAVAVFLEAEGTKPIRALDTWVAGMLTSPEPTKERCESLVQIGNHNLKNVTVDTSSERIVGLVDLHPSQLFRPAHGAALCFVDSFPLAQAIVVESAGCFQDRVQLLALPLTREQAVGKDFEQSDSLLSINVPLDGGCRYVTSSASEVATGPQRRKLFELRKPLPQFIRRKALAFLDYLCSRVCGPAAHKQVDMVRLDSQFQDFPTPFCTLNANLMLAFPLNIANQDCLASFRAPNKVIHNQVDSVLISFVFHVDSVPSINSRFNATKWLKPKTALPLPLKRRGLRRAKAQMVNRVGPLQGVRCDRQKARIARGQDGGANIGRRRRASRGRSGGCAGN